MENKELLEKSSKSESNDLASNINIENESETTEKEKATNISETNNDEIDIDHSQTIDNKLTEVKNDIASEEKPIKNSENENKNCSLDHKKDEKLKNIMTYSAIPFILIAIAMTLFKDKVRYPLSFLFISIGIGILAVFNFIRSVKLHRSCNCKDCIHHSKSSFKYGIFYGIVTLCFLGLFIYYMIV